MPKPSFDPTQPFEKVSQDSKPAFDPDKPFQAVGDAPQTKSMAEGAYAGFKKGGFSGIIPGIGDAIGSQMDAADLAGKPIEGSAPLAIPAGAAPSALLKVAQFIGASAPRRIAANTAIGAAQGAMIDPGEGGSRTKNALYGGATGLTLSSLGEAISSLLPAIAGKLSGKHLPHGASENYIENPELSQDTFSRFQNDPESVNRDLQDKIYQSLHGPDSVYENSTSPLLQKRGELLAGKTVQIDPSQFSGTEGEAELKRIAALTPVESTATGYERDGPDNIIQPEIQATPVRSVIKKDGKQIEIYPKIQATPVKESLKYGTPQVQEIYPETYENPVTAKSYSKDNNSSSTHFEFGERKTIPAINVPVSTIDRTMGKSGQTQTLQDAINATPINYHILKDGPVQTLQEEIASTPIRPTFSKGLPEKMSLTGPQSQRLKQILQDAADFKQKQFALGLAPKSEGDAIAGSAVRKALEGVEPRLGPLNEELQRNIQMSDAANSTFGANPSRILNNSESIGNTNARGVQKFLDDNSKTAIAGDGIGSFGRKLLGQETPNPYLEHSFQDLADAFQSGKAVSEMNPLSRLIMNSASISRPILTSPAIPLSAEDILKEVLGNKYNSGNKTTPIMENENIKAMQRRYSSEKK